MTQKGGVNVFDYEKATELPFTLGSTGSVKVDDIRLMIETAQQLGKAVVIHLGENSDGDEEFNFYAIERAD